MYYNNLFFGLILSITLILTAFGKPPQLTLNDVINRREQFMRETLNKPKYSQMRAAMKRRARMPPRVHDIPMNPELEKRVKELEDSAKQDQKLRDIVVGPNLEETNRPIFDMLHQGDMLLNNAQMRAVEREERSVQIKDQLKEGVVFGQHGILAADPPFFHKRNKRQILSATKYGYPKTKWETDKPISYYFEFDIDEHMKNKIREATKFWTENTCLSFKENGTIEPKIRYFRGAGCYSSVGKQFEDFEQDVSLGTGCELFGVAAHETGHSLGLFHHQSRFDRDTHIDLVSANIPPQWMTQYNKVERDVATTLDVAYDYGSDLHYPGYEMRSSKVMLAAKKKPYQHTMGNRRQPTFLDLKLVNEFYECLAKCPKHPNCKNGGFVNPNQCTKCICPSGFSGDDCSKRALGAFGAPENCGQDVQATNNWKTLEGQVTAKGQLDNAGMTIRQAECHYHIKAPIGQQIEIRVEAINGACTNECYYGATEIKFENMQMTGARLCCPGHIRDIGGILRTTNGLAVVSAYSQKETQKFKLQYRAVQFDGPEGRQENATETSETATTSSISTTLDPNNSNSEATSQNPRTTLELITTINPNLQNSTESSGQSLESTTNSSIESTTTNSQFLQSTTNSTVESTTNQISTIESTTTNSQFLQSTTNKGFNIDTTTISSTTKLTTNRRRPTFRTTTLFTQSTNRQRPTVSTTSSRPCRDIAINCQFQIQFCRSAVAAMQTYCSYTCGFCDN